MAQELDTADKFIIGIDLGTTYCVVGAFYNGSVQILQNSYGSNLTPSFVLFNNIASQTVGEYGKNFVFEDPKNTIFDTKRILGRLWTDKYLQENRKNWPFDIVRRANRPCISVNGKTLHPEQVVAKILKHLKIQAEEKLGGTVRSAVITVPAYFSDAQRKATLDAAVIAGLEVLELLNEPTAAALAYHKLRVNRDENEGCVLVFDLGGGTFDVAVIEITTNQINVLAIDGNPNLGGRDFDRTLVDYFVDKLNQEHQIDLYMENRSTNKVVQLQAQQDISRIENAVEKAKCNLSHRNTVRIEIYNLRGKEICWWLRSKEFAKMNMSSFEKTIPIVDRVLKASHKKAEEIQEVVLVGGSSRIKALHDLLQNKFIDSQLTHIVNPDEAVAYGATLRAAQLAGIEMNELFISDITPMAFGTDSFSDEYIVLLPKGSPVPSECIQGYKTSQCLQSSASIGIYQGNNLKASENIFLGNLILAEIPPGERGEEIILVTMKICKLGTLEVEAEVVSNHSKVALKVENHEFGLTSADVERFRKKEMKCTVTSDYVQDDLSDDCPEALFERRRK